MKVIIITTSFGFIALNEEYEVVSSRLSTDVDTTLLDAITKNKLSNMEIELIDELSDDYDEIVIETNKSLSSYESLESFDKN